MFVLEARTAKAEIRTQAEIDGVITRIAAHEYRPLLRTMVASASQVAGLRSGALHVTDLVAEDPFYRGRTGTSEMPVGDMLFRGDCAYIVQPAGNRLAVWELRRHDIAATSEEFCQLVEAAVRGAIDGRRLRAMDFDWKVSPALPRPRRIVGTPIASVRLETRSPELSPEAVRRAHALTSAERRTALLKLAQVGRLRVIDAALHGDPELSAPLLEEGLIRLSISSSAATTRTRSAQ